MTPMPVWLRAVLMPLRAFIDSDQNMVVSYFTTYIRES